MNIEKNLLQRLIELKEIISSGAAVAKRLYDDLISDAEKVLEEITQEKNFYSREARKRKAKKARHWQALRRRESIKARAFRMKKKRKIRLKKEKRALYKINSPDITLSDLLETETFKILANRIKAKKKWHRKSLLITLATVDKNKIILFPEISARMTRLGFHELSSSRLQQSLRLLRKEGKKEHVNTPPLVQSVLIDWGKPEDRERIIGGKHRELRVGYCLTDEGRKESLLILKKELGSDETLASVFKKGVYEH